MNEQEQMRQFAENLWNQFFATKLEKAMSQTVSYFRAKVTNNLGNGKLEVQRPFDTAHTVRCTDALSDVSADDEVTVFVFGSENGNNAVAVSDGSMSSLGSGGGGGGGTVTWSNVTNTPTTLRGYGITDAKINNGVITLGTMTISIATTNKMLKGDGNGNAVQATAGADYGLPVYTDTVTTSTTWSGSDPYTQVVTLANYNVTSNSKVDIQPNSTAITQMTADGVRAMYIENNGGTLTLYAMGGYISTSLTLQVSITEVTAT